MFNIGHTVSMETFDKKVVMIDAFDDIIFDRIARKCALELKSKNYNSISLVTDSQHLNQITRV
ncbi:MAG: diphthamide biosynthesis enzyme Dph2, partial [Thermoproteota archaeon]|nr:diphthamide biosynthesis enzyme Dph2 [Thermoproteota archaeon]